MFYKRGMKSWNVVYILHSTEGKFFLEKKITCMVCGDPFWGTIGELLKQKGLNEKEIDSVIEECNKYLNNKY